MNATHSARTRPRLVAALLTLPIARAPGTATAAARPRGRTITSIHRNSAAVSIPPTDPGAAPVPASRYPSAMTVRGPRRGRIRDVNLVVHHLSHVVPRDLAVLLVGPRGHTAVVMGHVGGTGPVSGVTLLLDDAAAVPLPADPGAGTPIRSGSYRPVNTSNAIAFTPPAPPADMNAALAVFDGTDPTGTWQLYVQNQSSTSVPVGFAGGWTLVLTVELPVKPKKRKRPARRRQPRPDERRPA